MHKVNYIILGTNKAFIEKEVGYEPIYGLSDSSNLKNIESLHNQIKQNMGNQPCNILEISFYSNNPIGKSLDPFILKYNGYPLECVFHSLKKFNNSSKPSSELLKLDPSIAKHRAHDSNVTGFEFEDHQIPAYLGFFLYSYLYCKAIHNDSQINKKELIKYNIFTSTNHNKDDEYENPIRPVCIYTYLYKNNLINQALKSFDQFISILQQNNE